MYVVQSISSVANLAINASFLVSSLMRPGTLASGSTHQILSPQSLSVNRLCPSRCFSNACCAFASFDCRLNRLFSTNKDFPSSIAIYSHCARVATHAFPTLVLHIPQRYQLKMLPSAQPTCSSSSVDLSNGWATVIAASKRP